MTRSDPNPDRLLLQQLQAATHDLFWFSEAEYPWHTYYWQDGAIFSESTLLQQHGYPATTKTAIQELNSFFAIATKPESWHNEIEQAEVRRYQTLVELLRASLNNPRVYLVGEAELDVYVLGETEHQAIAGLITKAIIT